MLMFTFIKQVQIEITDLRRETIRLILFMLQALCILPADTELVRHTIFGTEPFEHIAVTYPFHLLPDLDYRHHFRIRHKAAGDLGGTLTVLAEYHTGIVMTCRTQPANVIIEIFFLACTQSVSLDSC